MKNLLTKIFFISLLLSATIPSNVQADPKIGVIALAAAVPVVMVVVMAARTGNVEAAIVAGKRAMETMGEGMKITGVTMLAGIVVLAIAKLRN